jgi:hypothetical protein
LEPLERSGPVFNASRASWGALANPVARVQRESAFHKTPYWVAHPKALQPGLTREELAAALKDHVKGSAGLVTRFKHP